MNSFRAGRWVTCGLLLIVLGGLLGVAASGDGNVPLDQAIAGAIQRPVWSALDSLARFASRLGDTMTSIVIALIVGGALLWRNRLDLALLVAVAAALRGVGPSLKQLIESPRPPAGLLPLFEQADGWGYPSGHALGAGLLYGAIFLLAPEVIDNRALARSVQITAVVTITLIALSRVRLGVHWPSDVLGGVLFGVGFICILNAVRLGLTPPVRT